MLFAAYTPPSGYTPPPPRRQTNPLLIVLGVCGGCILIAIIAVVAFGAFFANKLGGTFQRSIAAAQFVQELKRHQYAQAEALLTPQAQQSISEQQLASKMASLEKKYGPLETGSPQPVIHQQNSNDLNSFNKITDYNVMLTFARGTYPVQIRFDTTPGQTNRIAEINWNVSGGSGSSSGGSGESGSGSGGNEGQ